jgi:hypothetical protein
MTYNPKFKKIIGIQLMRMTITATLLAGLPVLGIYGCTQMPTEKQGVSDIRPQISFKATDTQHHSARVFVDGLDMGSVSTYLDGVAALRIVSGAHQIRVMHGSQVLLDEKFYAGDGVNRTFIIQ